MKLGNLTKLEMTPLRRRIAYGAFAAVAFLFALRQTIPADAVRDRIVMEAAAQGWQVSMDDVGPAGLVGVSMRGVTLESREGVKIPLERVDASVRLLPLLIGRRGLAFDVRAFDGRVRGFAEQRGDAQRLVANLDGVDLARAGLLRRAIGVDLGGVVQGEVDLTFDAKQPASSAGRVDLSVENAVLRGGEVPVPGMGALTLPRIPLGRLAAQGSVTGGRLTFEKLEAKGDGLDMNGDGIYVVVQPRMAFAPIFGKAKLAVKEPFWKTPGTQQFRPIIEMALQQARGPDGQYGFQVYGTLSQPMARMQP